MKKQYIQYLKGGIVSYSSDIQEGAVIINFFPISSNDAEIFLELAYHAEANTIESLKALFFSLFCNFSKKIQSYE